MEQDTNLSMGHRTPLRFVAENVYGLLRTLRPKQWIKNGFVFMALLFDRKLADPRLLGRTIAAFVLFCMISSTVYIINDLADIEKDKLHPKKCGRALPSGQLRPWVAIAGAAAILCTCVPLAFLLSPTFGWIVVTYFVLNLGYSFVLKHVVIVDIMTVTAGFVLRVAAGVAIAEALNFSPWLYLCTMFVALFSSIGRRRHELTTLAEAANSHRRSLNEYTEGFLDEMAHVVATGAIIAYSLYTFSAPNLPKDYSMMLTIPFVIYGLFRYQFLIHVKGEGGAPEMLVYRDLPLVLDLVLWGVTVVLIMYVFHPA